jgi:hypothetical protein
MQLQQLLAVVSLLALLTPSVAATPVPLLPTPARLRTAL